MDRFVDPELTRLPLSGHDYIDIQKRLNHGDREDMFARMAPYITAGEKTRYDSREVRTAKVLAYLMGWSFTRKGEPVPFSVSLPEQARLDTIRALDPDTFDEIHHAIEAHEDAMVKARAAEKNGQGGENAASAISPSPDITIGASSGSVNSMMTIT